MHGEYNVKIVLWSFNMENTIVYKMRTYFQGLEIV
jgi:hypothetical protein